MSKQQRQKLIKGIAIGRVVVGATAWVAPNVSGRLFGLDPDANPQASYIGRLFGARDVVLGAGVLRASKKNQQGWVKAGVACDFADIAAGGMAGARGTLPMTSAVMVTATAAAFAALGTALLDR